MATSFIGQWNLPLGLRQNNPGNIRPSKKYTWDGEIEPINNYCVFKDVEHGIRAMTKDICSKIKRGLNTIEAYVSVYAPKGDNNFTENYIDTVSQVSGIVKDAILSPDEAILLKLIPAHIKVEVGSKFAPLITHDMIVTGVGMAF